MFLTPVALFVILYSVPRFFELETKFELRKLCPEVQNETLNNMTTANDLENYNNTFMTEISTTFTYAQGDELLNVTNILTNETDDCPTVWEPQLGIKPLRFNPYYVSVSFHTRKNRIHSFACQNFIDVRISRYLRMSPLNANWFISSNTLLI